MRLGELSWIICLAGLPWSYFFIRLVEPFKALDIWHANSWWMQGWGLVLVSVQRMNTRSISPLPIAWWGLVSWLSLSVLWIFTSQLKSGQPYPASILLGIVNVWSIAILAWLMMDWTPKVVQTISQAVFWSGVGLVCYGFLQALNLDQFFKSIEWDRPRDSIVGMIGNPTHFGCQLVLWMPFALIQSHWRWVWVFPAFVVIGLTHSATAIALAGIVIVGWWWKRSWKGGVIGAGLLSLCVGVIAMNFPSWIGFSGRLETWKVWWGIVGTRPILGWGIGFVKHMAQGLSPSHPLFGWKHLHNEYLQLWVEGGIISLGFVACLLWKLWARRTQTLSSPLRWACGWSLTLCLLMALTGFPFHLWQLGGWGLAAGIGWIILTEPRMA